VNSNEVRFAIRSSFYSDAQGFVAATATVVRCPLTSEFLLTPCIERKYWTELAVS